MNHTNERQDLPGNVPDEMRAFAWFDHGTGRLTGVKLTRGLSRSGASIVVRVERPDLDAAVPRPRGWHWFEHRGDLVCELAPTTQDVLVQVAQDIGQDSLGAYQLHGDDLQADQLRETATRRMSEPADEAEFRCARILRHYTDHLRRVEADDED